MQDQASRLREWVWQQSLSGGAGRCRAPSLVAILGGHPGVGSTVVALNLAAAVSTMGIPTVLLDGDLARAEATQLLGLGDRETLAEVISAGRTLADVLQPTSEGFSLIPGIGPGQPLLADPRYSSQRILDGLRSLSGWAEVVVADLGSQLSVWARAMWRTGQCRLMVSRPDSNILMSTYATLKTLTAQVGLAPVHVVLNATSTQAEAEEVYQRLANTCLRFLALPVSLAGFLPRDAQLASGQRKPNSQTSWRLKGTSADQMKRLAEYVAALLGRNAEASASPGPAASRAETLLAEPTRSASLRAEPSWAQAAAGPPEWHVQPSNWTGKLGFPVTASPSLENPVRESGKKV